jgi:hypothetical protein
LSGMKSTHCGYYRSYCLGLYNLRTCFAQVNGSRGSCAASKEERWIGKESTYSIIFAGTEFETLLRERY